MRILRIRLTNLNSLKGSHLLDLTAEPLASAGLFAITGPTGAGKTTLLDAVTLALYGKAARYGNESNPEHVMTRHCGECSAEVEFEVASGIFRAVWERHRAGKKPEGKLQPPKRYIYDRDGQPLAEQIREAEEKIEALIGLNYERFLRSVLLAQGDFAKFLKAKPDQRAELLESLTGTAVYSRLGKLAHTEYGKREADLQAKLAGLEQIHTLEETERKELNALVKREEKQRAKLTATLAAGSAMSEKITTLELARNKEQEASEAHKEIAIERKAGRDALERLRLHRLTSPFAEDLVQLETFRSALQSSVKNRAAAETADAEAKQALTAANFLVRSATEKALAHHQALAEEATVAARREGQAEAEARAWLKAHHNDAGLADQIGDLAIAIGALKNARLGLARGWAEWKCLAGEILADEAKRLPATLAVSDEKDLEAASLADFLDAAGKELKALRKAEKEAVNQCNLRSDHLEKAKQLAKYENDRHTLKPGEACSLCGALEHPFAEGAAPEFELAELEKAYRLADAQLKDCSEASRSFDHFLQRLSADREGLLAGMHASETSRAQLALLLEPLEVETPDHGSEDALLVPLQKRVQAYRKHQENERAAKAGRDAAARTEAAEQKEVTVLEKKVTGLPPLPKTLPPGLSEPQNRPSVASAEQGYTEAVSQERTTSTQLQDRREDAIKAQKKLNAIAEPLEKAVARSEFKTLDTLRKARLDSAAAEQVEALDSQLQDRTVAATALLKQAEKDIAGLLGEKVLEGAAAAAFKASQRALKTESDSLLEELATHRQEIATDDTNRKRRNEKERELADDRKALEVWRLLRSLIGSHDGSRFRKYAQSLSLLTLTRHANRHLVRLSDRYLICWDEAEALNLQIEDLHQAGVMRPMASLSGGESFLVSLALALGLSDLAGRTVRINSLFIDEGFGSLDSETLEVAIAALESLRQDHKTVGVISHVALLKERIGTQIVVEKQSAGVSRIRVIPEPILPASPS